MTAIMSDSTVARVESALLPMRPECGDQCHDREHQPEQGEDQQGGFATGNLSPVDRFQQRPGSVATPQHERQTTSTACDAERPEEKLKSTSEATNQPRKKSELSRPRSFLAFDGESDQRADQRNDLIEEDHQEKVLRRYRAFAGNDRSTPARDRFRDAAQRAYRAEPMREEDQESSEEGYSQDEQIVHTGSESTDCFARRTFSGRIDQPCGHESRNHAEQHGDRCRPRREHAAKTESNAGRPPPRGIAAVIEQAHQQEHREKGDKYGRLGHPRGIEQRRREGRQDRHGHRLRTADEWAERKDQQHDARHQPAPP